jgi:hypothetical protein
MNSVCQREIWAPMLIAALFTTARHENDYQLINGWRIYDTQTLLNTVQPWKQWNPFICDNTDELGDHSSKWNKPGTERQVLNGLTHMWKLKITDLRS